MTDWLDKFNPFGIVGEAAGKAAAEGWTGIMMALWSAGVWVLKWSLGAMDDLLTPDIRANGPAGDVYRTTFWIGGALLMFMTMVQLATALWRRRAEDLARVVIGLFQFGLIWTAGIAYAAGVLAACGGLTHALLTGLLGVDSWAAWQPMAGISVGKSGVEIALATVLGFLGLFLWIAAIGHFVIAIGRNVAVVVLVAVGPIAAAGLASDIGRSWFWKTVRWFHAAALTPVLTVLVLGIGTRLATAVSQGKAGTTAAAVGLAITSVVIIFTSVAAPLALFRLLAFVDPGTTSGASARAGLAAAGGVSGLMGGGQSESGSSAASTQTSSGQSQGEAQTDDAVTGRFASALSSVGGGVGAAIGAGMSAVNGVGGQLAATSVDGMNQAGVGDASYYPDVHRGQPHVIPDQQGGGSDGGQPSKHSPLPTAPPTTTGGGASGLGAAGEIPPVV
ncbi:hypothetical protein ASD11_14565 [Aeromicrobium sp. Root495]|uniref:hypothetical protein n=1 Tax=Aeromicrobium sp. Root495 TaxID=1736550 RepID=UPI0006FE9D13|nr:hypothetical protein [Aeromicrobium sp. Root495]KQY55732.1 hypothetical protein ASD11_14565 [Aeromicrobium sp. Root495]